MFAIYKREIMAYFTSPVGYVFCAAFFVLSGFSFVLTTLSSGTADTSAYFSMLLVFFIVLIPLLTMKLFSEEKKLGTEKILMASPVSLLGMVCAKFFAAYTLFAGIFVISACLNMGFLVSVAKGQAQQITNINMVTFVGCIVGILLVGSAFIAIGCLVSSLTESQMTAAVVTIAIFALMLLSSAIAAETSNEVLRVIIKWFSVMDRFDNFPRGVLDLTSLCYYFSLTAIFLFLTVRVYEKRRWE